MSITPQLEILKFSRPDYVAEGLAGNIIPSALHEGLYFISTKSV